MGYQAFPATRKVKALGSGGNDMGNIKLVTSTQLDHIITSLYIKGTVAGGESLVMKLYTNSAFANPIATSTPIKISDIATLNGGNWLGWVRFEFGGLPLMKNINYFVSIEASNYARSLDNNSYYISVLLDYINPVNTLVSANGLGVELRVVGRQ